MSPLSSTIAKGKVAQITLYASGAQGVTTGTMEVLVDPKLALSGLAPGEFLSSDGGTLEQAPGKNGMLLLTFKRKTGAVDSGLLGTLSLTGVEPGKAAVLIQGGEYRVGTNPISARVVNAMITVE